MLTEDYFMRMINQMLAVLTKILYLKEAGQYQEAQMEIDQSLAGFLVFHFNDAQVLIGRYTVCIKGQGRAQAGLGLFGQAAS